MAKLTAQEPPLASAVSSSQSRRLPPWVTTGALLLPTYGWLTIAVFIPLLAMFAFSFLTATPLGNKPIVFTLKQYRAFIDQPYLVGVGLSSLLIGFWTTFFCAVLGFFAALALARATIGKTKETLLVLILLPFWTNGLVRIFSWTMVLREGGFLDYILHLVAPQAGLFIDEELGDERGLGDARVGVLNEFDGGVGPLNLPVERSGCNQKRNYRQQKYLPQNAIELA